MIKNNFKAITKSMVMVALILLNCLLLFNNSFAGARSIDHVTVVTMKKPPFKYFTSANGNLNSKHIALKTIDVASNNIIDDDKWFSENDLALPLLDVPNPYRNDAGNIPNYVPATYRNNILVKAINDVDYLYLVYGENFNDGSFLFIMSKKSKQFEYGFDFINYRYSPKFEESDKSYIDQSINWVTLQEGTLFISHSHNTYASSSKMMNAYITAIDLKSHEIQWRSKPLVSNTSNFLIINDSIVTGYGFTAEPDYLFVLDKWTGKVISKSKVKTGPDFIIKKENKLFVRTYDTDYVYEIRQSTK